MKKYVPNDNMSLLFQARLRILNILNESGLTNAQKTFLLEHIKTQHLLIPYIGREILFARENQYLEKVSK